MQHEPLVLLGGHMCDARIFGPQISEFSKDRMVVVPPVMTGRSVPEYIRGLLNQLPAKFAVAGYDLGGFGAMELLHKVPDRVTRIALISTNALADTPPRKRRTRGRYHQSARGMRAYGDRGTFLGRNWKRGRTGRGFANPARYGRGIGAGCDCGTVACHPKTIRSTKQPAQMPCACRRDLRGIGPACPTKTS